jgi:hypothetical protein
MYLTPTLQRALVIGGVSLLAVVGLIGWTRHADEPIVNNPATANYLTPQIGNQMGNPEPVSRDPNAPVVYGSSPFAETPATAPAYRAYNAPPPEPAPMPYAAPVRGDAERSVAPARVVPQRRYYRTSHGRRRYVVVRKRPLSHSAAIVGGSAAGGALIGALAGGGKGAAIGALAGGGGGLIYDRATHKKTLVTEK